MMSDWELLQAYAKNRSENAFAELVRRHLNWVYSTALRQVRDPHLAEDVTQAVFVLLARKANNLRPGTLLSGWLFRTTRFVGSRALRTEYRRKAREQTAATMSSTISSDDNEILWNQLTPHLDQAVAALSQADRMAILLRFYEKKPLREVGDRLGLTEEAAKKRVSRAIEKLRTLITRRGVVLGGAALAVALAEQTVQAAPATLAATVLKASASATIPQLARETLNAWRWAKLKLIATIAAVSVAGGFFVVHMTSQHKPGAVSLPPVNTAPATQAEVTTVVSQTAPESASNPPAQSLSASTHVINILVVEQQTKQPIPGVAFDIFGLNREGTNGRTDKDGRYQIQLPEQDPGFLQVMAHKTGFVSKIVFWHTRVGTFHLPQDFMFKLEPATSIGGIVQDEQGQPIPGVSVSVSHGWSNMGGATEEVNTYVRDNVVTDANGRWRSDQVPADLSRVYMSFTHPEYFGGIAQPPVEKLRDMTGVTVMKRGLVVQGVVLGENNQPIEGVTVEQGPMCCGPAMKTDAAGRFRFTNLAPGTLILTFQAEDHAPELTTVDVNSQTTPLEIHLAEGNIIRGRVVDMKGNPVAHAWATISKWREHRTLGWETRTDTEGRFVWSNAPPDEVQVAFGKEGFISINTFASMPSLKPSEDEVVITLLPLLHVHGMVVDADTGESIGKLKVIPGSTYINDTNWPSWNEYGTINSTNGQYEIAFDDQTGNSRIDTNGHASVDDNSAHIIRVEADGYDPATSRPFKLDEGNVAFDFRLRKGNWLSATVRTPDGTVLEDANVSVSTDSMHVQHTKTGPDGVFRFPSPGKDYSVMVTHAQGFALVTSDQLAGTSAIVAQPWGRIEGTLRVGTETGANQTVVARVADKRNAYEASAQTDEQGNFVISRVPPTSVRLYRQTPINPRPFMRLYRSDLGTAAVQPGQTTRVVLGGTGRTIIGRVLPPQGYAKVVDWKYAVVSLSTHSSVAEHRGAPYQTMVDDDGRFRIDDVTPGSYGLNILASEPTQSAVQVEGLRFGTMTRDITVPPTTTGNPDELIDLGDIELQK